MQKYSKTLQIRWSDIDQNRHLRHSAFYDFGAMIRIDFLSRHGLTTSKMEALKIGPVLFREEAIFRKEIKLEDSVDIDLELVKSTPDFSRWTLRHNFRKKDGTLAAVVVMDGAWIDIEKRKLTSPGSFIQDVFDAIPKSQDYAVMHQTLSAAMN